MVPHQGRKTEVHSGVAPGMTTIEVWSDVACPWCFIGKRRLDAALAERADDDGDVEVVWRSFELNPGAPRRTEGDVDYAARLARKYGTSRNAAAERLASMATMAATDGVELRFDRVRPGNTFDAHRLLHLAAATGHQGELKERLLRAYHSEGKEVGDPAVLARLAVDVGLDADEVDRVLGGDEYADAVRADEAEATERGITAVPTFVIDGRFTVPGAQSVEVFAQVLDRARARRRITPP